MLLFQGRGTAAVAAWQSSVLAAQRTLASGALSSSTGSIPDGGGATTPALCCQICGKGFFGFNRKFLLKRHMIVHSGVKPYHCPHCNHKANIKQNLEVHIKRKHVELYKDFNFENSSQDNSSLQFNQC